MMIQWLLRQQASMIAYQLAASQSSSSDAPTPPFNLIPFPFRSNSPVLLFHVDAYKNTTRPMHKTIQTKALQQQASLIVKLQKKKPPILKFSILNTKMASVVLRILYFASFFFMAVRSDGVSLATGPAAAPKAPVAAAPSPGSLNLTAVLEKAGAFNTYISLLKSTQVGNQLQTQLNNSQQGITLFAPSDSAFAALKPGTLNAISDQDKIALLQYHALPSYYTFGQFQTVSNPVRTMASGNGGPFGMNFTAIGNSVNVSTGLVSTAISGAVYSQNPVAVYQVDKVLLPQDIFGPKPPAAAPAPDSGAPIVAPGVSPSSDGSAAATSGCRSLFVLSEVVSLGMAAVGVGIVGFVGGL